MPVTAFITGPFVLQDNLPVFRLSGLSRDDITSYNRT